MSNNAYYNEIDVHAAQWLRNLIEAGAIAHGVVDERDIRDVKPDDLADFTQCHFFAGIGIWSYSLREAGWEDSRPVWTGSCPCQPFSAAGRKGGFADERHLWPAFFHLIEVCRPPIVFGEQVASKDGLAWLDLVHADLEAADYACGAFDLCAASVGPPHIRHRLLFMAYAESVGLLRGTDDQDGGRRLQAFGQGREARGVVDAERAGLEGLAGHGEDGDQSGRLDAVSAGSASEAGVACDMGDSASQRLDGGRAGETGRGASLAGADRSGAPERPGPTNGLWGASDWIGCTDGKWRPVEPGSFPLVDGSAFRVGSNSAFTNKSRAKMLRGYGNGIVAPLATEFIRVAMECIP